MSSQANKKVTLKGQAAIDLWQEREEKWNQYIADNPESNIDFSGCNFTEFKNVSFDFYEFPNGIINFRNAKFGDGNVSFICAKFGNGHVLFEDAEFGDGSLIFDFADFSDGSMSFFEAVFGNADVSFTGAKFGDGSVIFDGAEFGDGSVLFENAKFGNGHVIFSEAVFGNTDVSFEGAQFCDGHVIFEGAKFCDGNVNFSGAEFFDGDVNFRNAKFGDGDVNFRNAKFGDGDVCFEGAKFCDGNVNFSGAEFCDGNLNFRNAKFGDGDVNFRNAKFGDGDVDFSSSEFGDGDVNFRNAKFGDGDVDFSGSEFGDGDVNFRNAKFGDGDVDFSSSEFGDGFVSFVSAEFGDGDVNFYQVNFGYGIVVFGHVKTNGSFLLHHLIDSSSIKELNFKFSTFNGPVNIEGNEFNCIPDFTNTKLANQLSLEHFQVKPNKKNLSNLLIPVFIFLYKVLWGQPLKYSYKKKAIKLARKFTIFNKTIIKDKEDIPRIRRLKELAETNKHHKLALDLHVEEIKSSRWVETTSKRTLFAEYLFQIFGDFGRSLQRPLLGLVGTWVVFTPVYFYASEICDKLINKLSDSAVFSFAQMLPLAPISRDAKKETLKSLYNDDMPNWIIGIAGFQSVISVALLFLIGLALRNRFRI